MKDQIYAVYLIICIAIAIGSFFGGSAFFTRRVNENFDKRYNADKAEREEAKREADEREQARIDQQILMQEQIVAAGYLAKETAEAHLAKCGTNKKIETALGTYADCRSRAEGQLRKSAAKYEQRVERPA